MFKKIHDWCMRQKLEYMDESGNILSGQLGELIEWERQGRKFRFKVFDDDNITYEYKSAIKILYEKIFVILVLIFFSGLLFFVFFLQFAM